ncbi:MAG TPA: hypothetical protein VFB60_17410 [Ktedonobacteraceae bacterium]|nr:hypothetical protein [Ktedonobacteraceae bacterium]
MASLLEQIRLGTLPGGTQQVQAASELPSSWPVVKSRLQAPGLAEALYFVTLPWFLLTGGATQGLVLLLVAYGLPRLVSLLLGGWLVQHARLRLVAGFVRALSCAALLLLLLGGHPALWLLCVLSACIGGTIPARRANWSKAEQRPIGVQSGA